MRNSEAKMIVKKVLPWLRWAMQLQRWDIDIVWGPIEDDEGLPASHCVQGQVFSQDQYQEATIEIDHTSIPNAKRLIEVLRHEMLHLLHADVRSGLMPQIGAAVSAKMADVLDVACQMAVERLVTNMERMFDNGIGLPPEAMIRRAKAKAKGFKP